MDIEIAIPSFETRALLERLLPAVRQEAGGARIVVVDTGSCDGSREVAAALADELVALDLAPGPAAHGQALDAALGRARARVLVTLDSDVVPLEAGWLSLLVGPVLRGEALAVGTTKDPRSVSALRRLVGRALGRTPGPEWRWLRPNRAAYSVAHLRALGLSFLPGFGGGRAVGEGLAAGLERAGPVARLDPVALDGVLRHLRHGTLALSPERFPDADPRDVRAAQARIGGYLERR